MLLDNNLLYTETILSDIFTVFLSTDIIRSEIFLFPVRSNNAKYDYKIHRVESAAIPFGGEIFSFYFDIYGRLYYFFTSILFCRKLERRRNKETAYSVSRIQSVSSHSRISSLFSQSTRSSSFGSFRILLCM